MTIATEAFTWTDDVIDVNDVQDRVEELEADEQVQADIDALRETDDASELVDLRALLEELRGKGGDVKWRGDWYPASLIRDSHFRDYAQELCEDCGDIPATLPSYIEVDWEATARNIRMDYTIVDIAGPHGPVTYWFR